MVSSTEIPKAILNTKSVDGFKGIPRKPITPPVIRSGIIFGIMAIKIILHDRKSSAIREAINPIANSRLEIKFFTKYLVPSEATTEVPVISKV